MIAARELAANWSLVSEKNCIVCSLFGIFITIIIDIIITIISSILFVVLLNCLYISTHKFLLLSILIPIPLWGKGRGK